MEDVARWANRRSVGALLWLVGMPWALAANGTAAPASGRVLRTVDAVHNLSAEEAALALPVHLRAVVTFCNLQQSTMFVQDGTGGVYVAVHPDTTPVPLTGDVVELEGVTEPGNFAAIVTAPRMRLVGHGQAPKVVPKVSASALMTGAYDSLRVEVEGTVRSVDVVGKDLNLRVATVDGIVSATMGRTPEVDYRYLTDARVRLQATAASTFNQRRQFVGVRLVIPEQSYLRVLEPSPAAPFETPARPIGDLGRFDRTAAQLRRVHLRGRVTLSWPGSMLCIEDATGGLCAYMKDTDGARVGAMADVIGFPVNGESVPFLTEASARSVAGANGGDEVVAARTLSLENDARLVRVEGRLVGVDQTAGYTTLVIDVGGTLYPVLLPEALSGAASKTWEPGSHLRVTGICSVILDQVQSALSGGKAVPKGFRLLLRSTDDVVVLSRPTWWTPQHSWLVVSVAVSVALLLVGWAAALRRTVERQTKTIRQSEERFRYMAQHDALTGLATRGLLHERLEAALAVCREEGTGLALLMVDLDHFKAINDTHGHDAGDETLRVTAQRMTAALREGDTVARLGGDEFIVLLTKLNDLQMAERVAAELVEVLCQPIGFGDGTLTVSASVGVCGTLSEQFDARSLLKSVDAAMYRAKAQGRRRFQAVGALEAAAV